MDGGRCVNEDMFLDSCMCVIFIHISLWREDEGSESV